MRLFFKFMRSRFLRRDDGTTAAEFALILPLLVLLTLGTIGLGSMMYMISALHFAAEDTARCASVKAGCVVSTYGPSRYKGPTIAGLAFTLNPVGTTCTNTVRGAGTYSFKTGLGTISVPVSAQACYPNQS
jgi:Flp pilus assembly pilin Flp